MYLFDFEVVFHFVLIKTSSSTYDIYFCEVFLKLVAGIRERLQSPSVARDDGTGHSHAPAGQSVGAGTGRMPFPI